jgi:hypothetical protein
VADICGHTRGTANVVEAERSDQRITLEKQRQWLANSSSSTEHRDLGVTSRGRREKARRWRGQSTNCRAREHDGKKRKVSEDPQAQNRVRPDPGAFLRITPPGFPLSEPGAPSPLIPEAEENFCKLKDTLLDKEFSEERTFKRELTVFCLRESLESILQLVLPAQS